jgi:hypothetical protein
MTDETDNVLRRASRAATAPLRNYINNHFEMVKQEVRAAGSHPPGSGTDADAWSRVSELENVLAEQSVHQARVLARLTEEIVELTVRVGDLERVVRQLAIVAAPPVPDE